MFLIDETRYLVGEKNRLKKIKYINIAQLFEIFDLKNCNYPYDQQSDEKLIELHEPYYETPIETVKDLYE